ncbi:MAG: hypothetical protein ABJF11_03150 [Reichenbachiella sp.]|uniref:WD40 repeat domain-containing protein n=1 Tax=Reichenbachiella sp. TaxID=2184521 RepID=UPI0032637DA2
MTKVLAILLLFFSNLSYAQLTVLKHPNTIYGLSVSRDGTRIVAAGKDSAVYVYTTKGSQLGKFEGFRHSIADVAFGLDSLEVVAVDYSGFGYRINLESRIIDEKKVHTASALSVNVLYDQNLTITTGRDQIVVVWKDGWNQNVKLFGHEGHTRQTMYHDSLGLISIADDKKIKIWDLAGAEKQSIDTEHPEPIWQIAMNDKNQFITGDRGGNIFLWTDDWVLKSQWKGHEGPISGIVAMDDYIITSGFDSKIKIWKGDKVIKIFKAHDKYCSGIALAENNTLLISSGGDGKVIIWSIHNLMND